MPTRKRISKSDLIEMLNGMAMLVDWQEQLVNAALQLLGVESEPKGRGVRKRRAKRSTKPA